jgi:hypothetical protein
MHPPAQLAPTAAPELRQVRRARKRAADYGYRGEHFTESQWLALLDASGGVCLACGAAGDLTVDHIIPLSLGGSNHIENIQPLCERCNCDKGATVRDYRERSPPPAQSFQAPVRLTNEVEKGARMMADKPAMSQDWKEVPRSEMFSRVMVAVDGYRNEWQQRGDEDFVCYVDEQLFPFLKKEMFNAEVEEVAQEELEARLDPSGVKQIRELSDEEKAEGRRLVRSCDAFGLMRLALDGESILPGDDKQNALDELRVHSESAEWALRDWQRKHGIPIPGE